MFFFILNVHEGMILTMAPLKRRGRKSKHLLFQIQALSALSLLIHWSYKRNPIISPRKKLQIVHHVLDGLSGATSALFKEHNISAYMSCVYLHKQKKIGFVLSTKPFEQSDGVAYFVNYLIEKNFYGGHDEDV